MAGAISMHTRLDIADLADTFEVSTTPVREAAMRLWGAGLLEPHPKGGLRAALATEARLRGLLDLNERLVGTALAMTGDEVPGGVTDSEPSTEARSRAIFRTIAAWSGNAALGEFVDLISDRLAVFRHREPEFLPDVEHELETIEAATGDVVQLRKILRRYHRLRMAHAPELVWAVSADSIAEPY